ncbi:hypothetical protein [Streptomyces sp. NPDC002825]|uniref:hypothetical protein n=1 Tax=Streptomyces sp. NPDC002825 TaxID=3154666 RepID=UPI003322810F
MREHDEYGSPERGGGGADGPPVYPGESTDTGFGLGAGTDTARGTDAGTDTGTGTSPDTGDTGTGTSPDTGDTGTGTSPDTGDTGTGTSSDTGTGDAGPGPAPLAGDASRAEGEGAEGEPSRLMGSRDEEDFRTRWHDIQSRFVDDPREAVHEADALVTDVIRKLADTFADRKKDLEGQWNQGEDVDTESLRMALRQYRSFFNRLLTT